MGALDALSRFHPCINWLSILVFTPEKKLTNVHTVSDDLSNSHMSNNTHDFTLVNGHINVQSLLVAVLLYNCPICSNTCQIMPKIRPGRWPLKSESLTSNATFVLKASPVRHLYGYIKRKSIKKFFQKEW